MVVAMLVSRSVAAMVSFLSSILNKEIFQDGQYRIGADRAAGYLDLLEEFGRGYAKFHRRRSV
jgi:hypothetical protein